MEDWNGHANYWNSEMIDGQNTFQSPQDLEECLVQWFDCLLVCELIGIRGGKVRVGRESSQIFFLWGV